MTKIAISSKKTNFLEYNHYDETPDGLQILFYTNNERTPPIVIPKQLFETWLGEQGAFLFEFVDFDHSTGEYFHTYKHALASDYWNFCDRSQIICDLREYLTKL